MLDGSSFTEIEFKKFMKAGFGDVSRLHPMQVKEMRRAFYGGLSVACFNQGERDNILSECAWFFQNEVGEYLKDIKE